ncbi:acyl-CoA/acyl-ACP dehydrogenase [Nocardioides anomalus]|uniref:Acyl-CoA/acyl-ACP dehydrogenase n=1 Tax=Nocardioides anomalus TaxID=2712223 RepID=A0A6G6WD38_9ACTN|nr:acyl-CoA dehydrogenase family protein [Nocardioides anomalus]QIG43015.1 acyl-CoA/acyl-ACP dehydrogenase [Nocardioides anomalus]
MDFALSEEQQALANTVRALLDKRADAGEDELWRALSEEVGVAALAVPEEHDGAGASLVEAALVLEEVGRSLVPSPLLASVVAAEALLAGGTDEARAELLPRIAAGELAAFAVPGEPALWADRAAVLLVAGDALLLADGPGRALASMDQTLHLGVVPEAGGREIGDAGAARARADLVGAVGVAALSVGLASRALEMTVAYSRERVQFGRPIGSFQALKHRMADLHVLVEMSRSAAWAAAYAVAHDTPDAERLAHVAKSYCSDALSRVAAETVQLHGGIAITWEHDAQRVFKRAHALGQLYGAPHVHRRLIALAGTAPAGA